MSSPTTPVGTQPVAPRRYLKTRQRRWAASLARALARAGVPPNDVSVMSLLFATLAGTALALSPYETSRRQIALFVFAAACIQLRLLANMLDGLLAIEGGLKSTLGDLYNEIPDRLADTLILVGAGYSLSWFDDGPALGWLAAVIAVFTAYVRLLGGSLGTTQFFSGPMAKQHRMFVLTVGCLVAAGEAILHRFPLGVLAALVVIVVGGALTAARRVRFIARELRR